jgi:hypothetical protein
VAPLRDLPAIASTVRGQGSSSFWRTVQGADYGPLNGVARHRVDTALITTHWDDLLRAAGSLSVHRHTVRASEIDPAPFLLTPRQRLPWMGRRPAALPPCPHRPVAEADRRVMRCMTSRGCRVSVAAGRYRGLR